MIKLFKMNPKLKLNKKTVTTFYPSGMGQEAPSNAFSKDQILKDIKSNFLIDAEKDCLEIGINSPVIREIETDYGMLRVGVSIHYRDSRKVRDPFSDPEEEVGAYEISLIDILDVEVYGNDGAKIDINLSSESISKALDHLNVFSN